MIYAMDFRLGRRGERHVSAAELQISPRSSIVLKDVVPENPGVEISRFASIADRERNVIEPGEMRRIVRGAHRAAPYKRARCECAQSIPARAEVRFAGRHVLTWKPVK